MKKSHTQAEVTQALTELVQEGFIGISIKQMELPFKPKAGKNAKTIKKVATKIKAGINIGVGHSGQHSILDGLAIGESRDMFGNSKHKVFSALARRARTHCSEKYSCSPVIGTLRITRFQ